MSTSTADFSMSISELSALMDLEQAAPVPSNAVSALAAAAPTLCSYHISTAPPTSASEPSTNGRFTEPAVASASVQFPAPIFPSTRSPNELMERAGSPPVVLPYTPTPPMPLAVLPTPDPSPLPAPVGLTTPSTPAAVPDSAPAKVERASSHASLISEEAGSATPIGALPSSPLSYCTEPQGTPPPESTSQPIQGLNRFELFEVVHPQTLLAWDAVPGSKVVVFIANDTVTKDVHHCVTLIRNALTTIFPDANPVIGSAAMSDRSAESARYPAIYPFLVHHLPELYTRRLILEHCWTVNDFTFFALDFSPPTTSFVMTLAGLHLPATPQSNDTVAQLIRLWLLNTPSVTLFIQKHHDNLPSFMTVNEQMEFLAGTVDVSNVKLGEEHSSPVAFNVYVHPPTNHPIQHRAWRCELEAITYFADCGTGKAAPLFRCDICKGRDHSSISCLFPSNTVTIFQNLGAQADAALASGLGDCREAVHINFNYFMRM